MPLARAQHLGEVLRQLLEPPATRSSGVGREVDGEGLGAGDHVVAQPRHRGELHPVGLLVHGHPAAEVGRVDLQAPLGGDDVRGDEQQARRAAGREVVLPQHLAREEGEQPAHLGAGDLAADRGARWRSSRTSSSR